MKITALIVVALWLLAAYGYFGNIYKLITNTDFEAPYKAEIIRGVGIIIPPAGIIMGYLPIEDGHHD